MRKGQVTLFIIIAIILVAGIIGFFLLKDRLFVKTFPAKFQPIENYFLDCVKQKAQAGKEILADRGGWIYPPDFSPGSEYAPFSSQLDFYGIGVPYWYYLSGNNFVKEQVPSISKMEEQLSRYVKENLDCDFSDFESQGYTINLTMRNVKVKINELNIDITVDADLNIIKEAESASQTSHKASMDSKLGRFYNSALKIYNYEKQSTFLENYAVDALRLYAPVDGVEISCAPKIWIPEKVVSELKSALEANIQAIKTKGNYYTLNSNEDKYFVTDLQTDDAVNFVYNSNWPSRVEIWPVENVMVAEPVGQQEGLGILGFCYVPYHFVYDMMFPVLVQVYDSKESFQFPVAVIIQKNKPRNALEGEAVSSGVVDLCRYKNQEVTVYTYDSKLQPVEADIGFKCFDVECDIGKTSIKGKNAFLSGKFPQCVNGFIIARAPGYNEEKYVISTNEEASADIVLNKLYNTSLDLQVGGKEIQQAIIYFSGEEYSTAAAWPEQKSVSLIEGMYNITLYVYTNSSLIFPATSQRKCVEVTSSGILGMFGQTKEQCFDINMPQQQITNVLSGGGKTSDYLTQNRLERGLKIIGENLPVPTNLDDLQKNYEIFDAKTLTIT